MKYFNYKLFSSDIMLEENEMQVLDSKLNECYAVLDLI